MSLRLQQRAHVALNSGALDQNATRAALGGTSCAEPARSDQASYLTLAAAQHVGRFDNRE
jgi:hypothetical protein